MLTFMGLDFDSAPARSAKLKALQDYFDTSDPKAFNMLSGTALSAANSERGDSLYVNSHGNRSVFAGYDAQQFFDLLEAKGFENGAFDSLYLLACSVGEQAQDNSILNNFARDLHRIFVTSGIDIKLYAPRGTLTYSVRTETKSGQSYLVVTDIFIASPERNYPLREGLLLVR